MIITGKSDHSIKDDLGEKFYGFKKFVGHPGLIWKVGLVYAFASFYVLTIPITGAFFAKRNWLMGKRYGFITPGDMFAYYYNNELVR